MKIDDIINNYIIHINNDLKKLYLNGPDSLVETFHYVFNSSGKRIRPILTLLSSKMCGGDIKSSLPAALSLELLHNFTLVHDDIMDNDQYRRGFKTIHEKWDIGTGILSGDLILSIALKNLIDNYSNNSDVIKIFSNGLLAVCEGQALDKEYESIDIITMDEYMKMIDLKTGHLLGMCTEIGSKISNADNFTSSKLREYGILLGKGFQIQDDYLEIFSNSKKMGKSLGSDILLNKKTFLMILSKKQCEREIEEALFIANDNFDLCLTKIRKILVKEGIKEFTQNKINEIFSDANTLLKEIKYNSTEISLFTDYISKREK